MPIGDDYDPYYSQDYNYTDPNVRAQGPEIPGAAPGPNYIPSSSLNPETGYAWNSKEDLAATNKLYGGAQGGQSAESWLSQYQNGNQATEGIGRTLQGLQASGYDAKPFMYGNTASNNEISLNGEKRKIIGAEGTPDAYWYQWGTNDQGQVQNPLTGGWQAKDSPTSYVPPASAGASSASASMASHGPAIDPQMREYLLRLMARSEPGAIDVHSDPNLGPQSQAYEAARLRGAQRERAAGAERAAFEGLNSGGQGSGAFDTSVASGQESAGRDIASHDAALVGQEVQARRNDLMNALQLANSIGARDEASQIQLKLSDLDNQYRYAALGQQGSQFNAQLGQQQGQFNDTFGLNREALLYQLNRDALGAAQGR
jgi:hypothetical protein